MKRMTTKTVMRRIAADRRSAIYELHLDQMSYYAKLSMLATAESDSDKYWAQACNAWANAIGWASLG